MRTGFPIVVFPLVESAIPATTPATATNRTIEDVIVRWFNFFFRYSWSRWFWSSLFWSEDWYAFSLHSSSCISDWANTFAVSGSGPNVVVLLARKIESNVLASGGGSFSTSCWTSGGSGTASFVADPGSICGLGASPIYRGLRLSHFDRRELNLHSSRLCACSGVTTVTRKAVMVWSRGTIRKNPAVPEERRFSAFFKASSKLNGFESQSLRLKDS